VSFFEGVDNLTAKGEWAFASWDPPPPDAFGEAAKKELAVHGPVWWRASFHVEETDEPVWFEPAGLTKGQIYLNNRHVGRYFAATREGKVVGPQTRYLLPRAWLDADGPNDLMVFEEHGGNAAKSRIVKGFDVGAF
jgi:hypothetical protein